MTAPPPHPADPAADPGSPGSAAAGHAETPTQIDAMPGESASDTRSRLLAQALDGSSSAILICDLQSRLLYANDGFERMFGYTEAELVG